MLTQFLLLLLSCVYHSECGSLYLHAASFIILIQLIQFTYALSCSRGMRIIMILLLTQIFSVWMYMMHDACTIGHILGPRSYRLHSCGMYMCMHAACMHAACMHACCLFTCTVHTQTHTYLNSTCTHSHTHTHTHLKYTDAHTPYL